MSENELTVIGLYQVRRGSEDRVTELVGGHWPLLHKHGLVTDTPARIYRGEWGNGQFVLEIATWQGDEALHSAFSIPEIAGLWQEVKEHTEDRNGRDGVEYPAVVPLTDFESVTEHRHPEPVATGVAIHQIRPDRVDEMRELLPHEWHQLRAEGFVPEHRPQAYLGQDRHGPFSISIVDWYEASGPQRAFMNDAINRVWRDVQAYTVGRAGRPASEYLWAEEITDHVTG